MISGNIPAKISTTAVGDKMNIPVLSLIAFSITLVITKSRLFHCKREYVEKRYQSSYVGEQRPSFVHKIWHAWWTCSMCCGFPVAVIVSVIWPVYGLIADTLAVFALNWLLHCIEDTFYGAGIFLKKTGKVLDSEENGV